MCEPVSIGAGVLAASSVMGGVSQKGQADYQASVANNNRKLELIKADQATMAGRQEAAITGMHGRQAEGQLRASAAARGVVVDEGSAAVGVQDIAAATAKDRTTQLVNSRRERLMHLQNAANAAAEREAKQAEGKAALFGSVLSAAGHVAGSWKIGTPSGGGSGSNVVTDSRGRTWKSTVGR